MSVQDIPTFLILTNVCLKGVARIFLGDGGGGASGCSLLVDSLGHVSECYIDVEQKWVGLGPLPPPPSTYASGLSAFVDIQKLQLPYASHWPLLSSVVDTQRSISSVCGLLSSAYDRLLSSFQATSCSLLQTGRKELRI